MTAYLRRTAGGWYAVCDEHGYEPGPYTIGEATRLRDLHNDKHHKEET